MSHFDRSRRGFLGFLTKSVSALLGLSVLAPAFAYICSPLQTKRKEQDIGAGFSDLGPLSELPVGQWRLLTLDMVRENGWEKTRTRRGVWVRREAEGDLPITVLSPLCPHLGCPINWHPDQAQFQCPCHGGIFDPNGRHVSGPPPRGMDALPFEVRSGRLWVRWQDFKIGVGEKVPVSA